MFLSRFTQSREPLTILFVLSSFCVSLSVVRVIISGSPMFLFLNWNLFLAIVPWLFAVYMEQSEGRIGTLQLAVLFGIWILFFPNSPYILTDLFHLRKSTAMPLWYDLILILSYAWAGLWFGFSGLMKLEEMALKVMRRSHITILVIFLLFTAGFGVYLGRFLRWNSWDLILHPGDLIADIWDRFADPISHPRTWGMTVLMGTFLTLVYFSLKALKPSGKSVNL